jgi:hypothetical protein
MATPTIDTTNSAGCSPCTPEAHQIAAARATESIEDPQERLSMDVIQIEKITPERAQEMRFDGLYKSPTETYLVVTDEEDRQRVVVTKEKRLLGFALQDLANFLKEGLGVEEFELHLKWRAM